MSRCVIVGGAEIKDYAYIQSILCDDDYMIFCDCGLSHMDKLQKKPHLIVGDFDSYEKPDMQVETIVLPCEKDDTDTVYAVKEAVKRGFSDFLLIGMAGQRLDHTIGNVSILNMLYTLGKNAILIDDYSDMEIVANTPCYVTCNYKYFSLLSICGTAKGVNIRNAKYPLSDAVITCEYQYGISNEVLKGHTAEVFVRDGKMLLIKIR